ncbi:hypothetical protein GCM10011511_55800 [Puia dinghuensis]|uniref:N-acetyltransferase domain-containing protein n=2 Tax=Puia dinghuensis TaxID=1792502 RepID=A0A8J2UJ88_9BACT|nr:hypothetical protein GCM10011511_55800 [Puia dinghuensis]
MRLAFGTFLKLPDPMTFMGDANYVHTRWRADPSAAFAAEREGQLVGSVFATCWGSVGFFGPLTVHPDLWDKGVASLLLAPVMECFDRWKIRHAGLVTFAESSKHMGLYRKFGFWPRFLTGLMGKEVGPAEDAAGGGTGTRGGMVVAGPSAATGAEDGTRGEAAGRSMAGGGTGARGEGLGRSGVRGGGNGVRGGWTRFSDVPAGEREAMLSLCSGLTDSIYEGLDLEREIRAVADQRLGDTVLLWDGDTLAGLAVCHCGAGSEAGSGTCYIKAGGVRPGANAGADFRLLLGAVEELAVQEGLTKVLGGANTGRKEAYEAMVECGYRTNLHMIIMEKPNEAGYNNPGVYFIDDWR